MRSNLCGRAMCAVYLDIVSVRETGVVAVDFPGVRLHERELSTAA